MRSFLLLLVTGFLLASCTETQYVAHVAKQVALPNDAPKSIGYFKVGKPYTIKGRRYYPKERYNFTQTGTASWYGPNFHGKMTANGEYFDKYDLTAAHRTLQMPSIIRVTNLGNGRSIILRVNDRGPYAHNRVLDVSERAATVLGFKNQGVAKIKLEVLEEASRHVAALAKAKKDTTGIEEVFNKTNGRVPRDNVLNQTAVTEDAPVAPVHTATAAPILPVVQKTYIQAGAFANESNALALAQKLSSYGESKVFLSRVNDQPLYRVRVGPFNDAQHASSMMEQINQVSNYNAVLVGIN